MLSKVKKVGQKKLIIIFVGAGYFAAILYGVFLFNQNNMAGSEKGIPQTQSLKLKTKYTQKVQLSSFRNNLFGQEVSLIQTYQPSSWKLTGIIRSANGEALAIISVNSQEKIYRLDDSIDSHTKIYGIEKDKVLIQHQHKIKSLMLFKKSM